MERSKEPCCPRSILDALMSATIWGVLIKCIFTMGF